MKRPLLHLALAFLLLPVATSAEEYRGHVQNLVIGPGQVYEEVHCFACSILIEGRVSGDLISLWGGAEIRGEVDGDVIIVGGGLRLGPGAIVKADAIVIGGPIERDPSAQVAGEASSRWWLYLPGQRQVFLQGASVLVGLGLLLALFGYGLFTPRRIARMVDALRQHSVRAFALGLIFAIALIFAISSAELLGDYEDQGLYLLFMLGFLAALPGFAAISLWLGSRLGRVTGAIAVAIGSIGWALLTVVPVVGLLAWCVLYALSAGTALLARLGFARQPSATP